MIVEWKRSEYPGHDEMGNRFHRWIVALYRAEGELTSAEKRRRASWMIQATACMWYEWWYIPIPQWAESLQ